MTDSPAKDHLAIVLTGAFFAAVRPRTITFDHALAIAVDGPDGRLVLIDVGHPMLAQAFPGADSIPLENMLAWSRTLPPLPATADHWTASMPTGFLTAPLRRADQLDLTPTTPLWSGAGTPLSLSLDIAGTGIIEYHCAPNGRTARRAAADLIGLLVPLIRQSPRTAAALRRILAGQPMTIVRDGVVARMTGQKNTVTAADVTNNELLVWDRRAAGGQLHLIDATADRLAAAVVHAKNGAPLVPITAVLRMADELAQSAPPDDSPLTVLHLSGRWQRIPGQIVVHDGSWTVTLPRWYTASQRPVRRLALRSDDAILAYDIGSELNLTDALDRLSTCTVDLPTLSVRVDTEPSDAAEPLAARPLADDITAAIQRTRQRAVNWLGTRREPVDRDAVDQVVREMLRARPDTPTGSALSAALGRVGVEDLEERHYGAQAVATLIIERELDKRIRGAKNFRIEVFADALTAYLAAVNSVSHETWPWTWQRIVRCLCEYLTGRRQAAARTNIVPHKTITEANQRQWDALAAHIPWIHWIGPQARDPRGGVPASPATLIDILVLLRPRQVPATTWTGRRYSPDTGVRIEAIPWRFFVLYCRAIPGLKPNMLDDLADALSTLLNDPAQTARAIQALELPAVLADEVRARIAAAIAHQASPEWVLALRVDDEESARVMVVNLSTQHGLDMRLDDGPRRLPPFAPEQHGAFGYCSAPTPITPTTELEIGDARISLRAPRVALAEGTDVTLAALPPDLFRGREEQLTRLRRAIGGSGPRAGSLIFGTRRAGKSTLAYQAGQDPRLRGFLWIDMSNAPESARTSYPAWNQAICRELTRKARRRLGIHLDNESNDFIELLADLDEQLDGGAPVVVILDELDMLLLPGQGSEGRRAAGRLGNLAWDNLVVIGTVQRFHRCVHEFKNWSSIECPADLSWADGVTYFLGPLADRTAGPRVEWLRRAGVTPEDFANEVVPLLGLRPYFWARLRDNLEGHIGGDRISRLVNTTDLRMHLRRLLTEDPHLNHVIDRGTGLDADERRRRDLFSDDERRILLRFATMSTKKSGLDVSDACAIGGEPAMKELVDRAYLSYFDNGTKLRVAVPIYHRFLRAHAMDLRAVLDEA